MLYLNAMNMIINNRESAKNSGGKKKRNEVYLQALLRLQYRNENLLIGFGVLYGTERRTC